MSPFFNLSPFASSVFAPAVADADRTFHNTSSILSSLAVTSYLFGYSVSKPLDSNLLFGGLTRHAVWPIASVTIERNVRTENNSQPFNVLLRPLPDWMCTCT